jgi:pterin-4a-carbinolamine dehydratase
MEYNDLLDRAGQEPNALKRMGLVAIHGISQLTICERTNTKPFNPLLGETFEFVNKQFSFLSEQVSHHPPITANYCRSNKGLYSLHNNQMTKTKFNGKFLALVQQFRTYVDLDKFKERYEIEMPVLSAHNLVIGKMYVDIGDAMTIRKVEYSDGTKQPDREEQCVINYTRSGMFTS